MAQKAPGKAHREGITLMQLADMFPNEGRRAGVVRVAGLAQWAHLPALRQ